MTSARSLAAALIIFSGLGAGCAVIPGSVDDTICLNCASPDGDASFSSDGGLFDVAAPLQIGARGSLCIGACNPKVASSTPDNPAACLADGGTSTSYDGGGTTNGGDLACRVILPPNEPEMVKCVEAGAHGDGASCATGADCLAGFECVGTPGVCRHYCCDETACSQYLTSTTNKYFCDVQAQTAAPTVLVPVCMVAQPCNLLENGCGDGMTCTLVDPLNSDLTSCVMVGDAQVGDSCEIQHCAANMICVGAYGQRTCRQLCNATHLCTYPQQCDGQWSQLSKFNVGICQ